MFHPTTASRALPSAQPVALQFTAQLALRTAAMFVITVHSCVSAPRQGTLIVSRPETSALTIVLPVPRNVRLAPALRIALPVWKAQRTFG